MTHVLRKRLLATTKRHVQVMHVHVHVYVYMHASWRPPSGTYR